jgi:hypothetical protein
MSATAQQDFKEWYIDILRVLSETPNAGFSIVMITLALLERYLREKSGVREGTLNDSFYSELLRAFPELPDGTAAEEFWQVYRNGLLHQVAPSLCNRRGDVMPLSGLRDIVDPVEVTAQGHFWVNPVKFAERAVDVIRKDFDVFLGKHSPHHPLSTVGVLDGSCLGTASPGMWKEKEELFKLLKSKS